MNKSFWSLYIRPLMSPINSTYRPGFLVIFWNSRFLKNLVFWWKYENYRHQVEKYNMKNFCASWKKFLITIETNIFDHFCDWCTCSRFSVWCLALHMSQKFSASRQNYRIFLNYFVQPSSPRSKLSLNNFSSQL